MSARKRMFNAVFPTLTNTSILTPSVTPLLGSSEFAFIPGFNDAEPAFDYEDSAAEQIRWDRAWHTATAFLSLPNEPITTAHADQNGRALKTKWIKQFSPEVRRATLYLISEQSQGHRLRAGKIEDDLFAWYSQEVGRHYIGWQSLQLTEALRLNADANTPLELLCILRVTQAVYLHPLTQHIISCVPEKGSYELVKFREGLHAIVAKSLSGTEFPACLKQFIKCQGSIVLGLDSNTRNTEDITMGQDQSATISEARCESQEIMRGLHEVGLGGAQAQRILAEVMSELLTIHVNSAYAGQWTSPSNIPEELRGWVRSTFSRFAIEILACLKEEPASYKNKSKDVTLVDVQRWQDRAICDLGALRLKELFEVIVDWDNDSKGAIEDLKHYVTTTAARSHLTTSFSAILSRRLLQPGAATTEILQVYICIIRAFAVLDPKGVLLDRIARPIRRYLRERDDTVKIIVSGLLADATDDLVATDVLIELAIELNKLTEISGAEDDEGDLDWDDMNWMPDPVDAGPDYKKSKASDVIGTLVSLFETKDIFVKEFQNIMGERLLQKETEFDREIRVLELLKFRFGESALQACEVMLRDVLDSRRVDGVIRKDQKLDLNERSEPAPEIHTKILSRLFWPALHTETFSVPPEIQSLQLRYATGFEILKQSRKLTWLHALGQVTVELQLGDRDVTEEVQTWQASLIYAFQGTTDGSSTALKKTVTQLKKELSMDESLVRNALTFWVGKLVLQEIFRDTYQVLETLSDSDLIVDASGQAAIAAAADAATSAVATAIRSEEEVAVERMGIFWQFIVGMLTNQGSMPLQRIVMMLKFAVPGGFPFGNEELREFLGWQVQEGKLELVAGNYKLVK